MITNPRFGRMLATMLTAVLLAPAPRAEAADTNEMNSFVAGNINFGFNVYRQFKNSPDNMILSPYSLSGCLGMAYAGARGNTQKQMAQALGYGTNGPRVHQLFGELQKQLDGANAQPGVELNVANGMWAQEGKEFLPEFLELARQEHGAALERADFRTGADKARTAINEWVEGKTSGKIQDLMPPGMPDASTRLVLVNAIHFKGQWARKFDPASTLDAPFLDGTGAKVASRLMHTTASFRYHEVRALQVLELPYAGGGLSMVLLLPQDTGALKILEAFLGDSALKSWLTPMKEQKVEVFLPKFKITASYGLAEALRQLGMTDALSPSADFSGMDGQKDLFISAAFHKAFVEVNEEGTEAAAATGTVMSMTAAQPAATPVFRADHPFIFVIRDNRSGAILFAGRLMDPSK